MSEKPRANYQVTSKLNQGLKNASDPRHTVSPTVTHLLLTPGKETGLLSNLIKSILSLVTAPLLVGGDAMCYLSIPRHV